MVVKLIPNNYQYTPGTWRYATRNQIKYKLDLHDYVDWWLYFGLKETSRVNLYNLVKPGHTIIDVGTNVGETLMNFAKLTGPQGKVFGFEPDSVNYKRCLENLSLNSFPNIEVNKVGLGHADLKLPLKVNTPSNRGGNRITSGSGGSENTETITITTLDQFTADKQISQINLIKIDVEGYELNVLMGAREILQKLKPKLFIELDDNNLKEQGQSATELVTYLLELDYTILHAETGQKIDSNFDFINCHFDIICS